MGNTNVKASTHGKGFRLTIIILVSLLAGCLESEFELAESSRLPEWIILPDGMARNDVTVSLSYYTGNNFKLVLREKGSSWFSSLQTIKGTNEHHPEYWGWAQDDWPARNHPAFVVLSVNGETEIVEHKKMEPIFYIANQQAVEKVVRAK
ncbi:MAG: hypothetical protein KUG83_08305 [Gammaproteobacteria bacterium]|nr:hypothetical protein [Gammaproteobacteria bacterium]